MPTGNIQTYIRQQNSAFLCIATEYSGDAKAKAAQPTKEPVAQHPQQKL
jgi:hypothetical protein